MPSFEYRRLTAKFAVIAVIDPDDVEARAEEVLDLIAGGGPYKIHEMQINVLSTQTVDALYEITAVAAVVEGAGRG